MSQQPPSEFVPPAVFAQLQKKLDEDGAAHEVRTHRRRFSDLRLSGSVQFPIPDVPAIPPPPTHQADTNSSQLISAAVHQLDIEIKACKSPLSLIHSTDFSEYNIIVASANFPIATAIRTVREKLHGLVTGPARPYHRWSSLWTRSIQELIGTLLLYTWLGGFPRILFPPLENPPTGTYTFGTILSLEDVTAILGPGSDLPTTQFKVTTEEYLHGLFTLADELARLARNAVVLGQKQAAAAAAAGSSDGAAAPAADEEPGANPEITTKKVLDKIIGFIASVHAGVLMLNLRNDTIRKRADAVKYRLKEVEDVVYDLSLRGMY